MHVAEKYADDILSGKRPAGKLIRLACERYFRDIDQAKDKGWKFDRTSGEKPIKFAALLKHYKGLGKGQNIHLLPHQQFQLWNLYGWKNDDGSNRFRRNYESVARKNGKTTSSAIRADYRIMLTEPTGAHIYCAATKEDQAKIMTNDAASLLISDAFFREKIETRLSKELISRVITKKPPYSFIRSIGRDSKTLDGLHASEVKIDEYHAWDSNYLLDVLEQSIKGRLNPLIDITTTAGLPFTGGKDGVCFAFEKMCIDILEGTKVDDTLFIMIHRMDKKKIERKDKPGEFDEDYDWENPDEWMFSNPALDSPGCVSMKDLQIEFVAAKNEGSTKEVEFKTKSLNIWTDAPKVWLTDEMWMRSSGTPAAWTQFGIG
jgi:phage terminase large subunit-like protein